MKKINIFLFLTLAMAGFSAIAMDEINSKSEILKRQIAQVIEEGIDLYELIDVSPSATDEEIKTAKRETLSQNNPDNGGDKEKFQKLNNAFEILTEVRPLYNLQSGWDQKLREKEAAERAESKARSERGFAAIRAEYEQKQRAQQEAREAKVQAYRQELERMSITELAEKFNFFQLLNTTYKQCEDFARLRSCCLASRSSADTELNEQVDRAYNILRNEQTRKEYNTALKKRLAREERETEEAEEAARPKKRSLLSSVSSFLSDNF